eukprot:GHVU01096381.1.p1 GENE.GHVU01096381.1~~GHVU01096381.1.p1  ORF type:complete len:445 (-),score=98.70 GHVU01096381.1:1121-2455(-)
MKFCYCPQQPTRWVMGVMANVTKDNTINFVKELTRMASTVGMGMDPQPAGLFKFNANDEIDKLQERLNSIQGIQLAIIALEDTNKNTYREVKYACEKICPTQCFIASKTPYINGQDRGGPGHLCNLLCKINQKLGGVNQSIHPSSSRTAIKSIMGQDGSVMVLGVDFSATAPGANTKDTPVFAAMIGNVDNTLTTFAHSMRSMKPRTTTLEANILKEMVHEIVKQRKERKKIYEKPPTRVLYLRDGISEGQFKEVLEEQRIIKSALLELGQERVDITTVVVQKRHQTRFFPKNSSHQAENVGPGLLVKDSLTHPSPYPNFYLLSHAGIKGTSHPVRYFQLHDDMKIDQETLQYFLYQSCHLFGRAQRTVSIPAPVYYAKILAERARVLGLQAIHTDVGLDFTSDVQSTSSGQQSVDASKLSDAIEVANILLAETGKKANVMFYV